MTITVLGKVTRVSEGCYRGTFHSVAKGLDSMPLCQAGAMQETAEQCEAECRRAAKAHGLELVSVELPQ